MWEITVKLRPIPSSAQNPQGSWERTQKQIDYLLEKYGHVQCVEIRETDTTEQMQIGGTNDTHRK